MIIEQTPKQIKYQAQFIERSSAIHNNKYDYSKVIYYNAKTDVEIICPEKDHGSFWQTPNNHLYCEKGCQKCNGGVRYTREEFIEHATQIHNGKYDYSQVFYKNKDTPVEIICPIEGHGSFPQRPHDHTIGQCGCPKCKAEANGNLHRKTKEEFLVNAEIVHGNKYDYSEIKFIDNSTHIKIICHALDKNGIEHGEFLQTPTRHINEEQGCGKCGDESTALALTSTLEEFIIDARKIHGNKYDYSKVKYKTAKMEVEIICPIKDHGSFWQIPDSHKRGCGCPKCPGTISYVEVEWLDSINVSKQNRHKVIWIDQKRYNVDAYDPTTNTIYEFYGDYWHGNPAKFSARKINERSKKTFGALYKDTMKREQVLIKAGYKVISIWENDWNIIKKTIKEGNNDDHDRK
jgi:hypothetical protein